VASRFSTGRVRVAIPRLPGGDRAPAKVSAAEFSADVPAVFVEFDTWTRRFAAASPGERSGLLAEGRRLAAERAGLVAGLIANDPEAAILLTPPPAVRAALPPEIADGLEKIVAAKGFYGVKAICNHGPDAVHGEGCRIEQEAGIGNTLYQASIYGARKERLTEEKASLYGVAIGDRIALHEDDFVILPGGDMDPARTGQLAAIHNGETTYFPDQAALAAHLQSHVSP
jgi:hypothetical protein